MAKTLRAGCYYYDSTGTAHVIPVGSKARDGRIEHSCTRLGDNSTRVEYAYETVACEYNGTEYQVNQTWTNGRMRFQCLPKGAYQPIGKPLWSFVERTLRVAAAACITEDGITELAVGEHKVVQVKVGAASQLQRCFRVGNAVAYQSYTCGIRGISCDVQEAPAFNVTMHCCTHSNNRLLRIADSQQ